MKKKLLFLMLSMLTLGAWADTYTPVAYIEYPSDGADNNARRFDTKYIVKQNTKIVVKFMAYLGNSWRAIFSGRDKTAGTGMSLYQSDDNQMEYFVGNWKSDRNSINLSTGTENIHTAVCTYDKLVLDGSETASGASSPFPGVLTERVPKILAAGSDRKRRPRKRHWMKPFPAMISRSWNGNWVSARIRVRRQTTRKPRPLPPRQPRQRPFLSREFP